MEKQLIEEISDGVATLTFNRPDRLKRSFDTDYGRIARGAAPTGAASSGCAGSSRHAT